MNKLTRFSSIPVGGEFEYKGQIYSRFTYFRGKQVVDGKPIYTRFPKHRIVSWINAPLDQLEQ